eukprot:jgi/Astpho2/655/Aster-04494
MQLPVVRIRSPSVVANAATNARTLKQKPLHRKAARAPDLALMQITGGASCDTYTRAFECAEGVLGQALTEPSLERSDWREVLTEFNFMKGKHLDLSTTTLGFVTRQAERPAMLAYSGAGVVLYTFDDATDGHMCLLLLEEVGVGSHRPSRHRWRDPHFKNGNQLTLSLPGGKREPMDPTPEATAQRELREESAGLISPEILRGGIEDMIYVGLGNFAFFPCQIASMEDIPAQYWGGHVGRSTDTHAHWVPVRDLPMRPISAFLEHALQKCPLLPWLYLRQVKHDREVQQARVQQMVHQVSAKRKAAAGRGNPPPAASSDPSWDSTISAMKASHGPQKGPLAGRSKGRAAFAKMVTAAAVDGWHRRRQHLQYTLLRARQRSSGEKLLGIEQLYSSDLPPAAGDGGNSSQGWPGKPAASDDDVLSRGQSSGSEGPSVQATGRAACTSMISSSRCLNGRGIQMRCLSAPKTCRSRHSLTVRAAEREPLNEGTEQSKSVPNPQVDQSKTKNIEAGNISNQNAEKRADIGATRAPTFTEAQAFDGPAPETINGRLAMLGITSALAAEFATGVGLKEQWLIAPTPIFISFAVVAIATYIPIFKGFTRKEPFENGVFTAKAENWNGRVAMVGWTILIVQEALTGKSIPAFWGF